MFLEDADNNNIGINNKINTSKFPCPIRNGAFIGRFAFDCEAPNSKRIDAIVNQRFRDVDGGCELIRSGMVNFEVIAGRIPIEFSCRGNRGRLWVAEMELPDCFYRSALPTFRGWHVFDPAASRQGRVEPRTWRGVSLRCL